MPPRIKITTLSNTRAKLDGDLDGEELDDLDTELRFHPDGYRFAPSFQRHYWDGYIHLLVQPANTFPLGLLSVVEEHLTKAKISFTVDDRRRPPCLPFEEVKTLKSGLTLRPDQQDAVRIALEAGRGIVKAATGSGKTEMIAALIATLTGPDALQPKTLVVVPNRNLLRETVARLEKALGSKVGFIGYGKWVEQRVTVAIPDTLAAPKFKGLRNKLWKSCEVLIADEAHHSSSKTWFQTLSTCDAYYRFGFSGTPLDRSDGSNMKLIAMTGPMVVEILTDTLVRQGVLAKPYVEMIEVHQPALPDDLDYETAYDLGVVRNLSLHKVIAKRVKELAAQGRTILVLVTRIAHGDNISAALKKAKVPHEFIHGTLKDDVIDSAKTRLKGGSLKVLVASTILGEGVDLPAVDVLVVADGMKSVIRTIQKAGRALRRKTGKANEALIIDFANFHQVTLLEHSLARFEVYKREKFAFV